MGAVGAKPGEKEKLLELNRSGLLIYGPYVIRMVDAKRGDFPTWVDEIESRIESNEIES